MFLVDPSGTLSARTGESVKLPVRARLSSFRSLWAVFRGAALKLCPLVRSCPRQFEVVPVSSKLCPSVRSCARQLEVVPVS